jgi:hypothetical protein
MNPSALGRNYDKLTPEERFRLILAAGGRGDKAERDRLVRGADRITLTMPSHAPYSEAFDELALLVFIELLDDAARYQDASVRANDALDIYGAGDYVQEEEDDQREAVEELTTKSAKDKLGKRPPSVRRLELAHAAGYVLRTKMGGWKLFCERMSVPHALLWESLPGFDQLQRTLALSETGSFTPERFLRWLNDVRSREKPELTEVSLTVERVADATMELFRACVKWWGG